MTVGISSIKKEAKASLNCKWVSSVVVSLVFLFSFLIIYYLGWVLSLALGDAMASLMILLLAVLLCGPLALGIIRFFWRLHNGMDENPATAFYYLSSFKAYCKAIKLCIMLAVRLLVFASIFYLPAIIIYILTSHQVYEFLKMPIPLWSQNLSYSVDFLVSLGGILTAVSLLKFYLAPFLVVADDKIDTEEALLMSKVISKSSLIDLIFLAFSLVLWIILSLLYIPLLFTFPYFIMCYIVHSSYAIKDYNEKIKKLNDENLPSFVAGI